MPRTMKEVHEEELPLQTTVSVSAGQGVLPQQATQVGKQADRHAEAKRVRDSGKSSGGVSS